MSWPAVKVPPTSHGANLADLGRLLALVERGEVDPTNKVALALCRRIMADLLSDSPAGVLALSPDEARGLRLARDRAGEG